MAPQPMESAAAWRRPAESSGGRPGLPSRFPPPEPRISTMNRDDPPSAPRPPVPSSAPSGEAAPPARISEAEAARLWQRAAELQARTLHQLEAQSREGGGGSGNEPTHEDPFPEDGYALADVRRAAEEAGIHPDFVERALGEIRGEAREAAGPEGAMDRVATRLLGGPHGSLVVRQVLTGKGEALLSALDRVLTGPGHDLVLVDMEGDDPLAGATLTFRVPSMMASSSTEAYAYRAAWLWAELLLVTIRPAPGRPEGDREAWEVEFLIPLRKGRRVNAWGSLFTGGVFGLGGGALGVAAGFGVGAALGLPALVAGAALVAGGAAGVGGGGWGGAVLYRLGWRHGAKEMEAKLNDTLRLVSLQLRTGGVFSLPQRRDDDGSGGSSSDLGFLPGAMG